MNVQITINERPLTVENGITILQAARQHAIYIPTLCDYPGLPAYGSCRMCIVEIQGQQNIPTACTTPVEEGMVILTGSPKVQLLRDELLKMLLAEHPSSCLFCPEKGHCDECMVTLRKAGVTTGCRSCHKDNQCELQNLVEKSGLDQVDYPVRYRMLPVEKNDPFFDRDYNLCVLCGRCIRTCAELHFSNALAFTERGTQTLVGAAFNRTHLEAGCSFCGACVEVCPTGALAEKTRKWDGKPDQETTTTCPLCSLGCQMRLLSKNNTVIGSLPDHSSGTDSLCVKGRFGITELVNHPTRLKQPQKAAGQSRLGIGWDEAVRLAAEKLTTCPPERFEMIVSSSCTNEDVYIAQKFTRQVMQSGRIHTIDQDGHTEDMDAFIKLLAQSQPLSVLAEAQVILCLGLDEQYYQSVVEVKLHQAKARGAKIIVVHSQEHSLRYYVDEWLQPLPEKEPDLIYELLERTGKPSPVNSGGSSERPVDRIEQAARLLQESSNITVIVGPSFLDHAGQARLLEAVDRLVNRLGARVIVLPDQGNLSGSLLLGIFPSGCTAGSQDLEVLYLVGENVPAFFPGHPFVIYQNIYPPSPGRQADLVLPAAAFSEEEGTFINHAGRLQEIHRSVPPPGKALPTWEILCRIAQKMGAQGFDYACVADIRAEIAGFIEGFQVGSFVDLSPSVLRGSSLLRSDRVPTWSAQQNKKPAGAGEADGRSLLTRQTHPPTYMGFPLAQWVAGLRQLPSQFRGLPSQFRGLPSQFRGLPRCIQTNPGRNMFKILENKMLVPNLHQATLLAGEIARAVNPGQFIILRVEEDGERIPLTVSDWDREKGTISLVYLNVGKTTQKLADLTAGAALPSVVGPLGNAMEIDSFGNVLCVGGCYGIASIYPIARALKEKGNKVTVVIEARSSYLLYWQERLKTVADRLVAITRDGSQGLRGHIGNLGKIIAGLPSPVDRIIINGCNYLMMRGTQESLPLNIKTMVSLNTLMIDGTGMCGVCRVTVGSSTKFACVDGPHFDGHEVNWEELAQRRKAYLNEETQPFRSSEA